MSNLIARIICGCVLAIVSVIAVASPTFAPPVALSTGNEAKETWGVTSVDVDGDYCPDLFFGNHRLAPSLYLGNCDGTFEERSELVVGDNTRVDAHAAIFGDFQADGCPDLHISVGGNNPNNNLHANQLLYGEPDSNGECSGALNRAVGADAEYPEQRGRSSVPLDADYDGDLDLVTTGFRLDSQGAGGNEQIFLNDGVGNLSFAPESLGGEFDGHFLTVFNIFANLDGDPELDLVCGESLFPRAQCSKDVRASSNIGSLLSQDLNLELVTPSGNPLRNFNVDAFAEDIDNDGDNDLIALRRINRAGNATRLEGNTVVESLNTTTSSEPMRCLGIPGEVDIRSLTIAGDYVNSRDIRFGGNNTTVSQPNQLNASARLFEFADLDRLANLGLVLPNIDDGVDENERGTYIGYLEAERMWKICDISGSVQQGQTVTPSPRRRFNLYGFRIEFTGSVGELVHEGYDPDDAPLQPVVWINNGDQGNGTQFENTPENGGLTQAITAFGLGKGDFDNDGDIDFVASYEHYSERGDHYLYTNDGNGQFTQSRFPGCPTGIAESVAVLDANNDGFLDPVISCAWFGLAHNTSHAHSIWLNTTDNDNRAIMFSLAGDSVNRSGFGARVTVTDANDQTATLCRREVGNIFGRGSQDSEFVHCGVAQHDVVDVIVDWPGTSASTVYEDVDTGGLYRLEESSNDAQLIRAFNEQVADDVPDVPSSLVIEVASINVSESANTAPIVIGLANNLTNNTANNISVDYVLLSDTAESGVDFEALSGTAIIAPGQQSVTVEVSIINDDDPEDDESFSVQLTNAVGATVGTGNASITISDDDPLPVVEANFTRVSETAENARLIIRLADGQTNSGSRDITVDYQTTDDTAVAGLDYTAVSGTAVIAPGRRLVAVDIPIINDIEVEGTETFSLSLSNASGAQIGTRGGIVTITSEDVAQQTQALEISSLNTDEAAGTATLTIQIAGGQVNQTQSEIRVDYATVDATAIADQDYRAASGTATIAPGQGSATIAVLILDDSDTEANESFDVVFSNPLNATLANVSASVLIVDNDAALPAVDVNFRQVSEQDETVSVFIRVENDQVNTTGSDIVVDYSTVDGTAVAGQDYQSVSGTATIAPGQIRVAVEIPIIDDNEVENPETFRLVLSNPSGAQANNDGGVITINSDDIGSTVASCSVPGNIAPFGITSQSSNFSSSAFLSSAATDGNFGNFTATVGGDQNPFWQIDLSAGSGQDSVLESIVLHNRQNCCGSRLRDIMVSVFDQNGANVFESALLNPENVLDSPAQIAIDLVALTGGSVSGSRIVVSRLSDPDLSGTNGVGGIDDQNVLSLSEVEIIGCAAN